MPTTLFSFQLYNEAGKMPLKTQLLLVLFAAILDVLVMSFWEPPKKSDMWVVLALPFLLTFCALCIYMPLQFIIRLILPKTHPILQAFLAYFIILCCFFGFIILGRALYLWPFSALIQELIRLFPRKELCGFLHFPAAFYLLILSFIYIIKPPKMQQASRADILDDNI